MQSTFQPRYNLILVPIRFRVLNTIKSWMNNFYTGSPDDPILLSIKRWAEGPLRAAFPVANSQTLVTSVEAQLRPAQPNTKVLTMTAPANVPAPILPKKLPREGRGLKLLDVHPTEIARQITIQQMTLYGRIKVVDCLDKAWSGDNASKDNNIKKMIHHANKVITRSVYGELMVVDWVGCRIHFDGGRYQETSCCVETLGSSC